MRAFDVLFRHDDELIFVVMDTENGGKVAVEANHQLVVFAHDVRELQHRIRTQVQEHFQGHSTATIRLREFKDTVIDMKSPQG